ncbi:hypothetical protein [Microtetraspora malaysiensis]
MLPEAVKSYLRTIMRKLGTHSRMETVIARFMPQTFTYRHMPSIFEAT